MSILSIELPESLEKSIEALASKQGYTLNQFITAAATEKLEAMAGLEFLRNEAKLGNREAFEHYLNAVPDVSPHDDDILEE
jgi:predicted DNA-binding protein